MKFEPRPGQQDVLKYESGWMGVSAVPGSGKTHTLSKLAASLVLNTALEEDQEVLIVTLVNSAVENFSSRVAAFIKEKGLLPDLGYRVRTLHGLAHDIVRERPDLLGLSDRFVIAEERESNEIIRSIVWNRTSVLSNLLREYVHPDYASRQDHWFIDQWLELCTGIFSNVIRLSKDLETTPDKMAELIHENKISDPLFMVAQEVYSDYQRSLNFRSAVDFDDLIRLAYKALKLDPDFLLRLRHRWPYILEDEAQDSSRLQELILMQLAGDNGNWVRVGDTNQAIYETFTTASPRYLRNFLENERVTQQELFQSGRSTRSIISLANQLIEWTRTAHPVKELREALALPKIYPTDPKDPQPNPPDQPEGIFLSRTGGSPADEVKRVVDSIKNWLPEHQDHTVAILVPRNERGADVVENLKASSLPCIELLKSSLHTRQTAKILVSILNYLTDPSSSSKLAEAFKSIEYTHGGNEQENQISGTIFSMLKKIKNPELLFPSGSDGTHFSGFLLDPENAEEYGIMMDKFLSKIKRWQQASLLPIDQLLLIISQDLFTEPGDLALVQKLALSLERSAKIHANWQLPEFSNELSNIANNEQRFLGFAEDENGFDPEMHKGKVVVATIHRAKGLEWDRVYLMSVNNYDFPSAQPDDTYISEKWFIRDHINIDAEILSKVKALIENDLGSLFLPEGHASEKARLEYCSERIRLFFVGITRAKKELIITWNTGKNEKVRCKSSLPLTALRAYWEEIHAATG